MILIVFKLATFNMQLEMCEFLLNEGADPLFQTERTA